LRNVEGKTGREGIRIEIFREESAIQNFVTQ
jgi:hypothetical protein